MALSVYKESIKGNSPSSIWMVRDLIGLLVLKNHRGWHVRSTSWIPDHRGGGENLLPHPQAAAIAKQLEGQRFATRREILQAIAVAWEMV